MEMWLLGALKRLAVVCRLCQILYSERTNEDANTSSETPLACRTTETIQQGHSVMWEAMGW